MRFFISSVFILILIFGLNSSSKATTSHGDGVQWNNSTLCVESNKIGIEAIDAYNNRTKDVDKKLEQLFNVTNNCFSPIVDEFKNAPKGSKEEKTALLKVAVSIINLTNIDYLRLIIADETNNGYKYAEIYNQISFLIEAYTKLMESYGFPDEMNQTMNVIVNNIDDYLSVNAPPASLSEH
jgi:hypothetical protein